MFSTVLSGAIYGFQSYLAEVEVDLSQGLPGFTMVGSLEKEVRESGERVRIALKNVGIRLPPMHVAVNLSPGDIKKEGTAFDLPIAAALLSAMKLLPPLACRGILMLGELGLNGEIKPVRGVLPIVARAKEAGISHCMVPVKNASEAFAVSGIKVTAVSHMRQAIDYLKAKEEEREAVLPAFKGKEKEDFEEQTKGGDFSEIIGQEQLKRAALLAAAGFHNLLITGPPGTGKTMIAKRLPGILPPLSEKEALEVSSVYSIAGLLEENQGLMKRRPFLNPHHSISPQALAGGGRIPRPGVISLAHKGVLFLDEMPEFSRKTLDLLRQPMEDKRVQIARSSGSFTYPADFMLVGAMNPCPCGYFPNRQKCRCTPFEIHNYISHISGPVLDRMDLCVEASKIELSRLQTKAEGESTEELRRKVTEARKRQEKRYQGTGIQFNGELGVKELERFCPLGREEKEMMSRLFQTMDLSIRAYHRMIRLARTIADVEGSDEIRKPHIGEAAFYQLTGKERWKEEGKEIRA